MLTIKYNNRFKRDYRLAVKRGCDKKKLQKAIDMLQAEQELPPKYRDYSLENSRNYKNMRECHIAPDWLLVYQIEKRLKILRMVRTGSHSDLF